MKYIIMCGGEYNTPKPKQLIVKNGEEIVARIIRLLREEGIEDIAISTNNHVFVKFGLPLLEHDNSFSAKDKKNLKGYWVDAFYPTDEPACYIFGDVYFSKEAIHKIVTTETDDIQFFASAPPFAPEYPKPWAEPFAYKVQNQKHFAEAIDMVKRLQDAGRFIRHPIAWELWQVIRNTPINYIDFGNYIAINDYSCDIDNEDQVNQWRYQV